MSVVSMDVDHTLSPTASPQVQPRDLHTFDLCHELVSNPACSRL